MTIRVILKKGESILKKWIVGRVGRKSIFQEYLNPFQCRGEFERITERVKKILSNSQHSLARKEPRRLDSAFKTTRKPKLEDRWWREGELKISAVGTPLVCCISTWTILPAGERVVGSLVIPLRGSRRWSKSKRCDPLPRAICPQGHLSLTVTLSSVIV